MLQGKIRLNRRFTISEYNALTSGQIPMELDARGSLNRVVRKNPLQNRLYGQR
jgi:hypothetical protein